MVGNRWIAEPSWVRGSVWIEQEIAIALSSHRFSDDSLRRGFFFCPPYTLSGCDFPTLVRKLENEAIRVTA